MAITPHHAIIIDGQVLYDRVQAQLQHQYPLISIGWINHDTPLTIASLTRAVAINQKSQMNSFFIDPHIKEIIL